MKLRLQHHNTLRVAGPVTGNDYLFMRRSGSPPVVDVDESDAEAMLAMRGTAGCCGNKRTIILFRRED